jgi:CheY-like chemotaxis protein
MEEDARRRCLEPFFTTKGERGTGLGLAMVYGMAQRHGADVQIESAPGRGTCVRLCFAVAAATERLPDEEAPVVVPAGLRILVVDDDPVLLRTLREVLEAEGHAVVAAGSGAEGIAAFQAAVAAGQPFSAVFTDLGMPMVDGRQVARAIKAEAQQAPVIMLTGWGERMVHDGDLPADVDMVLSKPPKLRTLREALASVCTTRSEA